MKIFFLHSLLGCFCSATCFAGILGESVQCIPYSIPSKKLAADKAKLVNETAKMLQLNNKYTLNKWYHDVKHLDQQKGQYLEFGGSIEKYVRPVSHHIFALAGSMYLGVYSSEVTGVSDAEAEKVLLQLIRSIAYRHRVNNTDKCQVWGKQWQSALWASQIAHGAWFIWDKLPEADQEMVAKMMEYEADRFIGAEPPYYRNAEGKILYKGDTKAEENAWNSTILATAIAMMPHHPRVKEWQKANILMQLSAYSTPEDQKSTCMIDGVRMCDVLKGSNINSDGTVINHSILHPDYMSAIMLNTCNVWTSILACTKPLESSTHNGDLVYKAVTINTYNGKTMYQPSADGKASCKIYFPQGNDWGGERQANYWLIDIMADQFSWADGQRIRPLEWAQVRSDEMMRMMSRDTSGQYYQSLQEDRFDSREEWIGQHLMWGLLGLLLD